jgi:hypothetical protein
MGAPPARTVASGEQPASDRKESGTFAIEASPARNGEPKDERALLRVDVSRADPRKRPTQKITRKLDAYVPPDRSLGSEPAPPSSRRRFDRAGLVALAILTLVAAVLATALIASPEAHGAEPPPGASSVPSASTEATLDAADALYRKGVEAFKKDDLLAAQRAFSEAYALKQSVEIAANLGIVELKLGKARDAAEHLATALRQFPMRANPEARAQLEAKLDEARARVVTVVVEVSPQGASVEVDGRTLGRAPIAVEVFVEPGERRFSATLEGHEPSSIALPLEAGTKRTVTLNLAKAIAPTIGEESAASVSERPLWPIVTSAGVTAVGLGLGIGFAVRAVGLESDLASEKCDGPSDCEARFGSDVDELNTSRALAGTGFGLAGLGVAGLVVSLLWEHDEETDGSSTAQLVPIVSPTSAGAAFTCSF